MTNTLANKVMLINKLQGDVTCIEELVGRSLCDVTINDEEILFHLTDTNKIKFYHSQDCCENVWVDDVCGDVSDLIGHEILSYEEVTESADDDADRESGTWTFYKIQTVAGHVTIRWLGESNGYYSESVDTKIII